MKKVALLFVIALALLLGACGAEKGFTDISVSELETMMASKDFVLINTHIPVEGDIAGTDAFVPYNEIEANLALLPEDKDAKIVLYCRSGNMSESAASELVEMGYTNVYELDGGFNAWRAEGLPFE